MPNTRNRFASLPTRLRGSSAGQNNETRNAIKCDI